MYLPTYLGTAEILVTGKLKLSSNSFEPIFNERFLPANHKYLVVESGLLLN